MMQKGAKKMPVAFDTLAFANKLKAAGVDPKIADVQTQATAEILNDLIFNQLATKQGMNDLETNLREDIKNVRHEITTLDLNLKKDMKDLKIDLQATFFKMIISAVAILGGVLGGLQTLFYFIK